MRRAAVGTLLCLGLVVGCGPANPRPVSFPNTDVSCPGGRLTWQLDIEDQRADRQAETRIVAFVRDAIQKSFPGCRWGASTDADAGTISIEIHRFASVQDAGSWEAAVEWTVSARNASGQILTQFEANEEVSRPNYQGSDNEKESLSEAFRRAIERTTRGLSAMSASGKLRHPEGTIDLMGGRLAIASGARQIGEDTGFPPARIGIAAAAGLWNGSRSSKTTEVL